MKSARIFAVVFVAIILFSLAACGRPYKMTKETYETGLRALEIIEKYNSGDITGDEAASRIDQLKEHLDVEREQLSNNSDAEHHNYMVGSSLWSFSFDVQHGGDSYADEIELKERLGK